MDYPDWPGDTGLADPDETVVVIDDDPDLPEAIGTDQAEPGQTADEAPPADRLHQWWAACVKDASTIPEAFTRPASLIEVWDYARTAAFTTADEGQGLVRKVNVGWAAVSIPFVALWMLLAWAQPRPLRAVAVAAAAVLIGTGVSFIPVLGWLVPGFLNVTTW